ncbi:Pollen allergen Phl p 11 [Apostasia shenzhenica]|uniref:Pollen allergen Phl p 11 n=1 Tax=Apostasia shenzhenica TaxID=1088818 RepID=A0A2I0AVA9_9ASPA|nr:Pollen allergen Phl p 11 [Apostasia shenzhenica]
MALRQSWHEVLTNPSKHQTHSFDEDALGHERNICEVKLASSPDGTCNTEVPGREVARIFLSHNNGIIASDPKYANSLGY